MSKAVIRKKIIYKRKAMFNNKYFIDIKRIFRIIKNEKIKNPCFGGYFPVNYEIDCLEILKKLEVNKYKICLPVIKKKNTMDFYNYSFEDPLKINSYGIPEPNTKQKKIPDILFVPLVAFDSKLYRIGYGGGYYDRYLDRLQKKKKLLSIGFAFSFQKVSKVPIEYFDKKLDYILTEKKTYK